MAKTHQQFVNEIKQLNPDIEVVGNYTRAIDRIQVRCKRCGLSWEPKAYSLSQGKGCPHCSKIIGAAKSNGVTGTKGIDTFKRQLALLDDSIEINGEYKNNKTKVECRCKRCGHVWYARPNSLLLNHGCPRCMKSGTSFMEQFILLSMRKVFGEREVISRDKRFIGMELDIFIPSRAVAIEPGNWFLHKRNMQRDIVKREKCKEKGVTLFTIYDQFHDDLSSLPFTDNCYCYEGDYNRSDHAAIRELVLQLLKQMECTYAFTENDWMDIEEQAYNNSLSVTTEVFKKRLSAVNKNIDVLGEYKNANIRIRVRCNKCGYEWDPVAKSLYRGSLHKGTKSLHKDNASKH